MEMEPDQGIGGQHTCRGKYHWNNSRARDRQQPLDGLEVEGWRCQNLEI